MALWVAREHSWPFPPTQARRGGDHGNCLFSVVQSFQTCVRCGSEQGTFFLAEAYLRVHSHYTWSLPGFSDHLEGEITVETTPITLAHVGYTWKREGFGVRLVSIIPSDGLQNQWMSTMQMHEPRTPLTHPYQAFELLMANADLSPAPSTDYTVKYQAPGRPRLLALEPQVTGMYAVWHCHNELTTSFDVWDGSTLKVLASSKKRGPGCAESRTLSLEAGKPYFVSLQSSQPTYRRHLQTDALDVGITLLRS